MQKSKAFTFFLLAGLFLIAAYGVPSVTASESKEKTVVATVNGSKIFQKDLSKETKNVQFRYRKANRPISEADIKKEALENLINSSLLFNESQKAGISISDEKVTQEFTQLKNRFPSPEVFENAIKNEGLTESDLKAEIAQSLAIREFIDQRFTKQVKITDDEIKQYYDANKEMFEKQESVRARHILIKVPENATDEQKAAAKTTLEGIEKQVKDGKDFAELAKAHSECPSSAKGGDLGFFERGNMVKPFETAAFSMDKGEVSPIVETNFGYHLIKVEDKRAASTMGYDQVKKSIVLFLTQQKVQEQVGAFLEKVKSESKIDIMTEIG
jgi:peptidyl-prolyl cis-trans isomerase C